jgi:hypothetical protein
VNIKKDLLGQEIKVGDKVVCMVSGYRSLMFAKVVKLTPKKVGLQSCYGYTTQEPKQVFKLTSKQYVVHEIKKTSITRKANLYNATII